MKKASLLLSAVGLFVSSGISHAVVVVYNIVNPALNSLTLSGGFPGAPHGPQGSAASMVDNYTGSVTADLTGGVLTFSGGSSLTAVLNPISPFAPPGAGIDNYGVTLNPALGPGVIAFRDMDFDIAGGTATNGSATNASFNFNAGHADYNAAAFGGAGTLPFAPVLPAANSSPSPVTLVTVGLTETLTIPVRLVFPGNATTPSTNFDGQFVLERTIPEPTSFALAVAGLAAIFRRRR